jgi:hypothetical protein
MSIRRAIEAHIKLTLDPMVPDLTKNWPHQVVESLRIADRPLPGVVVLAGVASPAFPDLPDSRGNFIVPVTLIVMSSLDDTTVDNHAELSHQLSRLMQSPGARRVSKIQGLRFYDIRPGSVGQENEGRRMITVLNFDAVVNYVPEQPIS